MAWPYVPCQRGPCREYGICAVSSDFVVQCRWWESVLSGEQKPSGDSAVFWGRAGEKSLCINTTNACHWHPGILSPGHRLEMKLSGDEYVYLDCRHLAKEEFIQHFPNIYNKCMSVGIDPMTSMIPVVPAQHYMCGRHTHRWIRQDESIRHLYACGECTSSGFAWCQSTGLQFAAGRGGFGQRCSQSRERVYWSDQAQWANTRMDTTGTNDPKEMVLITPKH